MQKTGEQTVEFMQPHIDNKADSTATSDKRDCVYDGLSVRCVTECSAEDLDIWLRIAALTHIDLSPSPTKRS